MNWPSSLTDHSRPQIACDFLSMAVTHLRHLPKILMHTEDAKLFLSDGSFFIAVIKPCLFLLYTKEEHVILHMSQNLGLGTVGEGQKLACSNRISLRESTASCEKMLWSH